MHSKTFFIYTKYNAKIMKIRILSRTESQCKCNKDTPRKELFFKETCFCRKISKYRFKKKSALKFPKNLD